MSGIYLLFGIYSMMLIKHFIVDFIIQTSAQIEGKGIYGNIHGILHSIDHGLFTLIFISIISYSIGVEDWYKIAILVSFVDFITHYHIDWAKMKYGKFKEYTINDKGFWVLIGLDQLMHNLVYVIIMILYVDFITSKMY